MKSLFAVDTPETTGMRRSQNRQFSRAKGRSKTFDSSTARATSNGLSAAGTLNNRERTPAIWAGVILAQADMDQPSDSVAGSPASSSSAEGGAGGAGGTLTPLCISAAERFAVVVGTTSPSILGAS